MLTGFKFVKIADIGASFFRSRLLCNCRFCLFSTASGNNSNSNNNNGMSPLTADDVRKFLEGKKIASEQGPTCLSFSCPSAPKSKSQSKIVDENSKIFVNTHTGAFVCNYCLQTGDYAAFQNLLTSETRGSKSPKPCQKDEAGSKTANQDLLAGLKRISQLTGEEFSTLCARLQISGQFLQTTFAAYDCYVNYPGLNAITFPYFGPAGSATLRLRGVRTLSLSDQPNSEPTFSRMRQRAHRDLYGLFGWNMLSKKTTEVILTASELDTLAISQSLSPSPSSPVVVMTLPRSHLSLPQYVLPLLEPFRKVTIWLGSELSVWQAAKQFARKLGEKRCYLVRPSDQYSSAHDALAKGIDLKDVIANAYPAAHKAIVSFSQLRQDVFAELAQSEQVAGIRWRKFTRLNELLKGHRRGELTIFTGPTGAGKTTFISDYSLDLAMQGVATLWGSFEISNVRLCKLMLTQFAGRKLLPNAQLKEDFRLLSDQFEQLPIHFLTFHGSESLKRVVEAMQHAVYVHDIVHVVIDNLQFMMDVDSDRMMLDRFQKQDQIIAALRRFATQQQCHVTLVIHPRKEADGQPLTNSSIFGGVKAVQEADNVMLLQPQTISQPPGFYGNGGEQYGNGFSPFRNNNNNNNTNNNFVQPSVMPNTKCIQITKNRFDGELGRLHLRFNRDSLSFEQLGNKSSSHATAAANFPQKHDESADTVVKIKPPSEQPRVIPAVAQTPIFSRVEKPTVVESPVKRAQPTKQSHTNNDDEEGSDTVDDLLADLGRASSR